MFSLPETLSAWFVLTWLTMEDWARLDSACCQHSIRPPFLHLLTSRYLVDSTQQRNLSDKDMKKWIITRKIKVSNIIISEVGNFYLNSDLLDHLGIHLKSVRLESEPLESFDAVKHIVLCKKIASTCQNLINLSIDGISNRDITSIVRSCPQLQRVGNNWNKLTDVGVLEVAAHCKQLRVVPLMENSSISPGAFKTLLENCKHVQEIGLVGSYSTNKYLGLIAEHIPLIRHVNLFIM